MQNIQINFSGFYNSRHSEKIDFAVDFEIDYLHELNITENDRGKYLELFNDYIDYKSIYNNYINEYCACFSEYIKDAYSLNIDFKNISLTSPREYNFMTDSIMANISKIEYNKLLKHFKKDKQFIKYLDDRCASYSGFISYYTYGQALQNKNDILQVYIFEYLSNEFESTANDYLDDLLYDYQIEIILNDAGNKHWQELEIIAENANKQNELFRVGV